jgi:hypothetical protein
MHRAYRVTGEYMSALIAGPVSAGDYLWLDDATAAAIHGDCNGILEPDNVARGACLYPDELEARQRERMCDLGHEAGGRRHPGRRI